MSGDKRAPLAVLACAAALLLAARAGAVSINSDAGTSGAQFLKLGSGARAGGMADAFSAIADDPAAVYYNPAGMAQLRQTEIGGAHTAYFQGINYEVLNLTMPFQKEEGFSRHSFGLGIYQVSVTNIEQRSNDTVTPLGTFNAGDSAYSLSYSYGVNRRLSAGVTGKYIVETISSYRASAYAMDAGVLYHPNPDALRPVALSAVIRNVGTRESYVGNASDPLPASVTFGGSVYAVPKALRLNLEFTKYRDENTFVAAGGEWVHSFSDALAGSVRAGYTSERTATEGLTGITAGGGLTFRKASFDFAWVPFGVLGDTFRYSLVIKF